ncbi:MAG TPA: tannase/feruloyl esterase family alpha/beta hydrolase [Steroidobacteraceae bacterium]|nr:tannase/feruloyl esterase family alpha/beta hydrolase [Steroidobacteraceae bacterium]
MKSGNRVFDSPIVKALWLVSLPALSLGTARAAAGSCESLARLKTPHVLVSLATEVSSGHLNGADRRSDLTGLPPFCRVVVQISPTVDSRIGAEIWLPVTGWNKKFLAVGSGGWGGAISYHELAEGLNRGYAVAATDDGHRGAGASFLLGHPEKLIDYAYRAEHETTLEAKRLIEALYGQIPAHSYWSGCSGGGREGLLQAARYPTEFDGVVAGDPANIRRNAWALSLAVQTFKDPSAYIPPEKYPMIHQAVLNACDAIDGLRDGLIEEPERCQVNFRVLECKGADIPTCLTPRQVQSAQALISPLKSSTGKILFPRLEPGTELRWARLAGGPEPASLFLDEYRYVVFANPNWDWRTFDLDRDAAKAHAIDSHVDEFDPNLTAFANRGGKMLIYHGWADQQVAPGSSIDFYDAARERSPVNHPADDWIRLFMAPGMGHCQGGEGPDTFDALGALEQWVEKGRAPERIIASQLSNGQVVRTRPLCPYPQFARYDGKGNPNDAASFMCRSP